MKRALFAAILTLTVLFAPANMVAAHTGHEAEGQVIQEKLQNNELQCEELTDSDFNKLGEYFMGQMTGEQHETMGNMMNQMMGEEDSEQMHITMGKRMSGCEPDAMMENGGMMSMMSGGMMGGNSFMGGFGMLFMVLFMIIFWGLVIIGIVALVRWIMERRAHEGDDLSAHNTHKGSSHNGKPS